jgi:hypothetical protein
MGSKRPTDDIDDVSMELESSSRSWVNKDDPERLSVTSRQRIRDQMQADIEAFLARGGQIEQLDISTSAHNPRPR